MRSETFGRLLKAGIGSIASCEGRTSAVVEEDLGGHIGVTGDTIQRYKSGFIPPDPSTIKTLAEACIQRGLLGREWAQRFLHAARYPNPDTLLEQFHFQTTIQALPQAVYHNLPAPNYSKFIPRPAPFIEVCDGLSQRSAMVIIYGLGGNGKTSIAREVASLSLMDQKDVPHFDAAIWISDKDRPGTTTFSIVLDTIAQTLGYPGFTQLGHDEKRREVDQLVRRQRVLIVIDNFETITDGNLLSWLLRLPEPSKALITSREYRRDFQRGGWPVELRGMNPDEARLLIDRRLHILKLRVDDPTQFEPLVEVTGGNPKAVEMALGLIKYEHRPFSQVVDDLYNARSDLFEDLFARSWSMLDHSARLILLSMPLFMSGTSSTTLATVAGLSGFTFDRALELLTNLALIDVQQENLLGFPRYSVHPLVRAFAKAQLNAYPDFEREARERWMNWYAEFAARFSTAWTDLTLLELLDTEHQTLYSVAEWALNHKHYRVVLQISKGLNYFYPLRGLLDKKLEMMHYHAEAARQLNDVSEEVLALSTYLNIHSRQGNEEEVAKQLPYLDSLVQMGPINDEALAIYQTMMAEDLVVRGDFKQAYQFLLTIDVSRETTSELVRYMHVWFLHLRALCVCKQGDLQLARTEFEEVLRHATRHGYVRRVILTQTELAAIAIDMDDYSQAEALLSASILQAERFSDWWSLAPIYRFKARLSTIYGNTADAQRSLVKAIDLFQRLGMRHELIEAREALAQLKTEPLNSTHVAP